MFERADNLRSQWQDLVRDAKRVDVELDSVKETFTEHTSSQVQDFQVVVAQFKAEFTSSGPDSVGRNMDAGLELLESYRERLAELKEEGGSLALAQKLFNLSITSYPELAFVESRMAERRLSTISMQRSSRRSESGRRRCGASWTCPS